MKRRWVIVAITSVVLIGAGILVRTDHKNRQQAAAYRIRAEQGDAESQFKLGSMYSRGKGVSQATGSRGALEEHSHPSVAENHHLWLSSAGSFKSAQTGPP